MATLCLNACPSAFSHHSRACSLTCIPKKSRNNPGSENSCPKERHRNVMKRTQSIVHRPYMTKTCCHNLPFVIALAVAVAVYTFYIAIQNTAECQQITPYGNSTWWGGLLHNRMDLQHTLTPAVLHLEASNLHYSSYDSTTRRSEFDISYPEP